MQLVRVVYELFEWDAEPFDRAEPLGSHQIHLEIQLLMVGGEGVYVAWDVWQKTPDDDPDWLPYAVGMSPQPFCKQPAEITRDMSASAVWKGLIGQEIDFAYLDPDHQILEIRGGSSAVYCSSYSTGLKFWGMDVLHVSASRPTRTSPGGSKQ